MIRLEVEKLTENWAAIDDRLTIVLYSLFVSKFFGGHKCIVDCATLKDYF